MLRRATAAVFSATEGFLDRLVCVLGGVLGSQAPEFFQQYQQRLGGHLDEARRQLAAFEAAARAAGRPLAQFALDTLASTDAGVAQLGASVQAAVARVESLAAAQQALAGASLWSRPFVFLAHFDGSIARATAAAFRPAVPTTVEGAVYAIISVGAVFLLWHLLVRLPLHRFLLRPAHQPAAPARV